MQFAQSTAQQQQAFSRALKFLILILLDRLVRRFFYTQSLISQTEKQK